MGSQGWGVIRNPKNSLKNKPRKAGVRSSMIQAKMVKEVVTAGLASGCKQGWAYQ